MSLTESGFIGSKVQCHKYLLISTTDFFFFPSDGLEAGNLWEGITSVILRQLRRIWCLSFSIFDFKAWLSKSGGFYDLNGHLSFPIWSGFWNPDLLYSERSQIDLILPLWGWGHPHMALTSSHEGRESFFPPSHVTHYVARTTITRPWCPFHAACNFQPLFSWCHHTSNSVLRLLESQRPVFKSWLFS